MSDRDDIDALIRDCVQNEDRTVPPHLLFSVLADAKAVQPRAPAPKQSWLTGLLDMLGGWQGAAAMAASLLVGIGLGAGDPASGFGVPGFADLQTLITSDLAEVDSIDALGVGEFDLGALEF